MAYPLVDFSGSSGTQLTTFDPKWLKNGSYTGSAILNGSGAVRMSDQSVLTAYYYNDAPTSADYSVELDLVIRAKAASQLSVCGRMSATANTMYFARYNSTVEAVQLYKLVSGSATQLGGNVSVTVSNGQTHRIKLFMSGSTIKVFWNGSELISQTDSSISASGYGGFRFALNTTVDFNRFSIPEMEGGGSTTTTISATLANITSSVSSVSAPKTVISGTLANVTGSLASATGSMFTTITATLGNVVGSITSTGSTTNGTFTSEVLKDYAGNVLANTALNFMRLYNDTTGALVLNKTGVSTNGSGIVTFSDAALVSGTTYRVDWETAAGSRRMPRKAAA